MGKNTLDKPLLANATLGSEKKQAVKQAIYAEPASMPINYNIDHDQCLVMATPHGVLTDGDVFGNQQEVWSRADTSGYNELIDMTGVSQIEFISADRVADLADLSGSMDSPASASKLAIIATAELHFGLGRMYQARREMAEPSTKVVRVFRDRQEALQWLGIRIEMP